MRIHNTMCYNNTGDFAFCNNLFDQVFHRIHAITIKHCEQVVDNQEIMFNSDCPCKGNPLLLSPGHWAFGLHKIQICLAAGYLIFLFHLTIIGLNQPKTAFWPCYPLSSRGKRARIDPLEILKLVDVGECFQSRIELPELFNRHITGVDTANHRAKGIGLVIIEVS